MYTLYIIVTVQQKTKHANKQQTTIIQQNFKNLLKLEVYLKIRTSQACEERMSRSDWCDSGSGISLTTSFDNTACVVSIYLCFVSQTTFFKYKLIEYFSYHNRSMINGSSNKGRILLRKWGFKRCKVIAWSNTNENKRNMNDNEQSMFIHTMEHCGICMENVFAHTFRRASLQSFEPNKGALKSVQIEQLRLLDVVLNLMEV